MSRSVSAGATSRAQSQVRRADRRRPDPTLRAARSGGPGRSSLLTICIIWTLIVFMIVPEDFNYGGHLTATFLPTEGSTLSRVTWLALLGLGVAVPLSRFGLALKLVRQINPYMLVYIGLAVASIAWSNDPGVTIRRLVRTATFLLDAMSLALVGWNATRFQSTVRTILVIILGGSIIFGLLEPKLAIEQSTSSELVGAWRGLTTHKNALGSLAATGVVLWAHAWLSKECRWWTVAMGGGVAVACLVLSRSSTSLMAGACTAFFLVLLLRSPRSMRRYLPYVVGLFVCILLIYGLAVLHLVPGSNLVLSPITMITGKDQTFSNRADIWAILTNHIALHPFAGSGFGAYWVGAVPNSPSYEMLARLGYYPAEGHNGYLDVINDLGALGGFALLGYVIAYVRQALRIFAVARTQGALYLAILFQQLMGNLSESHWFNAMSVDFVFVTITTVCMARTAVDLQPRPHPKSSGLVGQRQ